MKRGVILGRLGVGKEMCSDLIHEKLDNKKKRPTTLEKKPFKKLRKGFPPKGGGGQQEPNFH